MMKILFKHKEEDKVQFRTMSMLPGERILILGSKKLITTLVGVILNPDNHLLRKNVKILKNVD